MQGMGWCKQDITEEIYKFHLNRLLQMPRAFPLAMGSFKTPGYSVQIHWKEFLSEDLMKGRVSESECELLVLDD
jgi:hypothetical protein